MHVYIIILHTGTSNVDLNVNVYMCMALDLSILLWQLFLACFIKLYMVIVLVKCANTCNLHIKCFRFC